MMARIWRPALPARPTEANYGVAPGPVAALASSIDRSTVTALAAATALAGEPRPRRRASGAWTSLRTRQDVRFIMRPGLARTATACSSPLVPPCAGWPTTSVHSAVSPTATRSGPTAVFTAPDGGQRRESASCAPPTGRCARFLAANVLDSAMCRPRPRRRVWAFGRCVPDRGRRPPVVRGEWLGAGVGLDGTFLLGLWGDSAPAAAASTSASTQTRPTARCRPEMSDTGVGRRPEGGQVFAAWKHDRRRRRVMRSTPGARSRCAVVPRSCSTRRPHGRIGAPGVFVAYGRAATRSWRSGVYRVDTGATTRLTARDGEIGVDRRGAVARLWVFERTAARSSPPLDRPPPPGGASSRSRAAGATTISTQRRGSPGPWTCALVDPPGTLSSYARRILPGCCYRHDEHGRHGGRVSRRRRARRRRLGQGQGATARRLTVGGNRVAFTLSAAATGQPRAAATPRMRGVCRDVVVVRTGRPSARLRDGPERDLVDVHVRGLVDRPLHARAMSSGRSASRGRQVEDRRVDHTRLDRRHPQRAVGLEPQRSAIA